MTTLTEFLLARLAEDEAVARDALGERWTPRESTYGDTEVHAVVDGKATFVAATQHGKGAGTSTHIARHDPARVLRDVEAKRRIVERCGPEDRTTAQLVPLATLASDVLRDLALSWSDHPDYRDEWKP